MALAMAPDIDPGNYGGYCRIYYANSRSVGL